MTISSEIIKLNTNLTNSYTACSNKGATMPTNQNFDNLASTINSISSGGGNYIDVKTVIWGNAFPTQSSLGTWVFYDDIEEGFRIGDVEFIRENQYRVVRDYGTSVFLPIAPNENSLSLYMNWVADCIYHDIYIGGIIEGSYGHFVPMISPTLDTIYVFDVDSYDTPLVTLPILTTDRTEIEVL